MGTEDEFQQKSIQGLVMSQSALAQTVGELKSEVATLKTVVVDLNSLLRDTGTTPALMGRLARVELHNVSLEQSVGELKSKIAGIQVENIKGKYMVWVAVISTITAIISALITGFRS